MGGCSSKSSVSIPAETEDFASKVTDSTMMPAFSRRSSGSMTPGGFTPGSVTPRSCRSRLSGSTQSSVTSDLVHVISTVDNTSRLRDYYSVERTTLGVGSFSTVCKGRNRASKRECAIKTISKSKVKSSKESKADYFERIKREISILQMLEHKNIVTLLDAFEDERTIRLVMELCSGGELSDRLTDVAKFTESQVAGLMQQVFQAVNFMHSQQVCHRDIKPNNILFESRQVPIEQSTLKIIDFGSARVFQKGQYMHTKAGSSYYVSPQVLLGKYDHSSDLWSCGVVMHIILCGYPPFTGETEDDVLAKVRKGTFTFNAKHWKKVSKDAKNLVSMLIKKNPQERYTSERALNDSWICNKAPQALPCLLDNVPALRKFQSGRKLKKAGFHVIAEQLTLSQIRGLEDIFGRLAGSSNATINTAQLRAGLSEVGLKELPGEIEDIAAEFDSESADTGVIDYQKFVDKTLSKKQVMQETALWNIFNECELSSNGKMSFEDLAMALNSSSLLEAFGSECVEEALLKGPPCGSGDGGISFDDFMLLLGSNSREVSP